MVIPLMIWLHARRATAQVARARVHTIANCGLEDRYSIRVIRACDDPKFDTRLPTTNVVVRHAAFLGAVLILSAIGC